MRLAQMGCLTMVLGALVNCGGAQDEQVLRAAPQAQALTRAEFYDDFGPAFAATLAWPRYEKSGDAGCAEAVSQVNLARESLGNSVQWPGILALAAYEDTDAAWGQYYHAGCSTVGKPPESWIPRPTQCDALRQDVNSAWAIVVSTPAYQSLVEDGTLPAVEQAFSAAQSAGCVY